MYSIWLTDSSYDSLLMFKKTTRFYFLRFIFPCMEIGVWPLPLYLNVMLQLYILCISNSNVSLFKFYFWILIITSSWGVEILFKKPQVVQEQYISLECLLPELFRLILNDQNSIQSSPFMNSFQSSPMCLPICCWEVGGIHLFVTKGQTMHWR